MFLMALAIPTAALCAAMIDARTITFAARSPPSPSPVNNLTVPPSVLLASLDDAHDVSGLLRPRGSTLAAPPPGLVSPANESVTLLAGIFPNATFEIITIEFARGDRDDRGDRGVRLSSARRSGRGHGLATDSAMGSKAGGRGTPDQERSSATAQRVIRRYLSRDLRTYDKPTEFLIPGLRAASVRARDWHCL